MSAYERSLERRSSGRIRIE